MPPDTPKDASYQRQVTLIILHHLENFQGPEPCPELPQIGVWRNGFGSIPAPAPVDENEKRLGGAEVMQEYATQMYLLDMGWTTTIPEGLQDRHSTYAGDFQPRKSSAENATKSDMEYVTGLDWDEPSQQR